MPDNKKPLVNQLDDLAQQTIVPGVQSAMKDQYNTFQNVVAPTASNLMDLGNGVMSIPAQAFDAVNAFGTKYFQTPQDVANAQTLGISQSPINLADAWKEASDVQNQGMYDTGANLIQNGLGAANQALQEFGLPTVSLPQELAQSPPENPNNKSFNSDGQYLNQYGQPYPSSYYDLNYGNQGGGQATNYEPVDRYPGGNGNTGYQQVPSSGRYSDWATNNNSNPYMFYGGGNSATPGGYTPVGDSNQQFGGYTGPSGYSKPGTGYSQPGYGLLANSYANQYAPVGDPSSGSVWDGTG